MPLLVIVPAICIVLPVTVTEALASICKLVIVAIEPVLSIGYLLIATTGTFTVGQKALLGTNPSDQLLSVFQSVLAPPVHRLWMLTVAVAEYAVPHPLDTSTLHKVGTKTLSGISEIVILPLGPDHVVPPSTDVSQPTIVPTWPISVMLALAPSQTAVETSCMFPPATASCTVMIPVARAFVAVSYTHL